MADLTFGAELRWSGRGTDGQGFVTLGEQSALYSAPASMGGKGVGTSPEQLLIAAVSACYSGTLFGLLTKAQLPVREVAIRSEGIVTGYPLLGKFAVLRVHPTIEGGDPERLADYRQEAERARDRCFIGKTIRGNVEYEVGEVSVK